jgi:4a-hydroxytetrahydrobiopterin dehydratase
MVNLDPGWRLENNSLVRRLSFKGFAKPLMHANLAAFIGDREGHHPDIAFGWGYCTVTFTTHAISGLSENDFICAAKFDAAAS